MRDRGYDCDLLIYDHEANHFHPSCDTYATDNLTWIRKLDWGSQKKYLSTSQKRIENDIDRYDILIGCGSAAAYCKKINRILNIFVPYGGDIWTETFYRITKPNNLISTIAAVRAQRSSFKSIEIIHSPHLTVDYEKQINRYLPESTRWLEPVPMIYAKEYLETSDIINKLDNLIKYKILDIREKNDFILTAHGRHVWGDSKSPASKGNKILIDGWKLFCDQHPLLRKKIIFMEYGVDVNKSKKYIKEIGLEKEVEWFPLMKRKEIMPILMQSDMVAGEFIHSWIAGGVINEALVAGKPLLMHSLYHSECNESENIYKIFNSNTPEGIARCLFDCVSDMNNAKKIGIEGQRWYLNNVQKALSKYDGYLNLKYNSQK
jgi:hypothetical protein